MQNNVDFLKILKTFGNFSTQQCTARARGTTAVNSKRALHDPEAQFAHRVCKSGAKRIALTHRLCMKCTYSVHCNCTHRCYVQVQFTR